jgi:hypothetical protein
MERMMVPRLVLIVSAALCLATTGCQPRSVPVLASSGYESEVRTISAPRSDRARLYLFLGKTPSGSLFGPAYRLHGISGDIYVDDVKIGSLNPDEALVVDMIPGKHMLYWHYLNQTGGPFLKSERFESNFQGATAYVLFANMGFAHLEIAPGTVTTKDSPGPANNTIPSIFKIVRPGSCPPTICL